MQDWVITKRQLGLLFVAGGVLGAIGVVLLDVLRRRSDFGPTQAVALAGCVVIAVIGLTLIPLGNKEA
jgi:hypothetical protein